MDEIREGRKFHEAVHRNPEQAAEDDEKAPDPRRELGGTWRVGHGRGALCHACTWQEWGFGGGKLGTSGDKTLMATAHLWRFRHFTETPALSIENIQAGEQIAFGFEAEVSDS
jgi:hypothetical protein